MKLSVHPDVGSRLGSSSDGQWNAAIRREVELYNTAVDAEAWGEARDRAGSIAVRLEGRDHPDSVSWWQREAECERLVEAAP